MKYRVVAEKSGRRTKVRSSPDSPAGRHGAAMAPPDYGIDFVDRRPADAGPIRVEPPPLVQRKSRTSTFAGVVEAARSGVSGTGGPLPFLDQIQKSFGAHDVRGIQAHTGTRAARASAAIGAEAYAVGDQVAFAGSPSLHTAAHEAAHVVQQRHGVQLPGGLGRAGDRHERQADAVAATVVQGRSAEPLLDEVTGPSQPGLRARAESQVQLKMPDKGAKQNDAGVWDSFADFPAEVRDLEKLPDLVRARDVAWTPSTRSAILTLIEYAVVEPKTISTVEDIVDAYMGANLGRNPEPSADIDEELVKNRHKEVFPGYFNFGVFTDTIDGYTWEQWPSDKGREQGQADGMIWKMDQSADYIDVGLKEEDISQLTNPARNAIANMPTAKLNPVRAMLVPTGLQFRWLMRAMGGVDKFSILGDSVVTLLATGDGDNKMRQLKNWCLRRWKGDIIEPLQLSPNHVGTHDGHDFGASNHYHLVRSLRSPWTDGDIDEIIDQMMDRGLLDVKDRGLENMRKKASRAKGNELALRLPE